MEAVEAKAVAVGGTEDERHFYRRRSNPLSQRSLPTPSTGARENSLPNSPNQEKTLPVISNAALDLHANNHVINPSMMEELPSSIEDEEILEDADATPEGAAVEVQARATRPLFQPSAKKRALHNPIAMERLIAYTVGKNATRLTCAPSYLKSNSHSSK